jgi:hypothetical protein
VSWEDGVAYPHLFAEGMVKMTKSSSFLSLLEFQQYNKLSDGKEKMETIALYVTKKMDCVAYYHDWCE